MSGSGDVPGVVAALLQSVASPTVGTVSVALDGMRLRPLLRAGPIEESDVVDLRRHFDTNEQFRGTLVSNDGSMVGIYATFELSHALPGYVNLQGAVEQILSDEDDGTFFSAYLSGPVVVVAGLVFRQARLHTSSPSPSSSSASSTTMPSAPGKLSSSRSPPVSWPSSGLWD